MRRFSTSAASSVALLLACASALFAQATVFVSEGSRVKIFPSVEGAEPVIGTVVDVALDTLIVLSEREEVLAYRSSDLWKIEVSEGEKKKTFLGLWAGAGVGLATGLLICAADEANCETWSGTGDATAAVVLLTTVLGGGVGALVGSLIKTERWEEASFPNPPPVAFGIGKDGSVRLAFSLRL
jgi:hypothetical protein